MSSSCSTIVGARPSESSSMMRSRGLATKAMPRPSCCCSPPERFPAIWSQRSRSRGKSSSTRSTRACTSASSSLAYSHVPQRKCSATVNVGNTARPPGTWMIPSFDVVTASAWVMSRPSKAIDPAMGSTSPEMALSSVDFPAPLVPSRATISPSCTSRSTPNSTCTWS